MVAVPAADVVDELVFCGHRWRFRLELTEEQERLDIPGRLSSVGEVNSPLLARGSRRPGNKEFLDPHRM